MAQSLFNFVEGIWWIGLGVFIFRYYRTSHSQKQSPACFEPSGSRIKPGMKMGWSSCMAIILVLFGISDFVEISAGTWWQPWWLLIWKGFCIGVGLILIIYIYANRRP